MAHLEQHVATLFLPFRHADGRAATTSAGGVVIACAGPQPRLEIHGLSPPCTNSVVAPLSIVEPSTVIYPSHPRSVTAECTALTSTTRSPWRPRLVSQARRRR